MESIVSAFNLQGRVAIVTGATGLLGREYSDALAEAGADVVLVDLQKERCVALADEIAGRHGVKALPIQCDISDKTATEEMARETSDQFGSIDILVNNAALTVRGGSETASDYFAPFEEYPLGIWQKALSVGLTGTFLCSQAVGKRMSEQQRGVIINISSIYGVVAPDQRVYANIRSPYDETLALNTPASYSAIKGGVLALTRYLSTYWAGRNIRVNALTLGGTLDNHSEEFVRNYSYRTPLGRMGNKTEYRGAIVFLASDASSYMTGANLVVDGGWTAW